MMSLYSPCNQSLQIFICKIEMSPMIWAWYSASFLKERNSSLQDWDINAVRSIQYDPCLTSSMSGWAIEGKAPFCPVSTEQISSQERFSYKTGTFWRWTEPEAQMVVEREEWNFLLSWIAYRSLLKLGLFWKKQTMMIPIQIEISIWDPCW